MGAGVLLGLNCGGSDSFSGISANPALGVCSDLLAGNDSAAVRMTSSRGMAYFENGVMGSGRKQPGIGATLGSAEDFGGQPGAALTFSNGGPWPYRLHGPNNDWSELKWAEDPDAPIRFSTEKLGEQPARGSGRPDLVREGALSGARIRDLNLA